jgi:hypothetical protein
MSPIRQDGNFAASSWAAVDVGYVADGQGKAE